LSEAKAILSIVGIAYLLWIVVHSILMKKCAKYREFMECLFYAFNPEIYRIHLLASTMRLIANKNEEE
jgi:hypothetical protein